MKLKSLEEEGGGSHQVNYHLWKIRHEFRNCALDG